MKYRLLLILFVLSVQIQLNAQYAVGTYSFYNNGGLGGNGTRNQWSNSFNWVVWDGSNFISTGVSPSSGNNVIINTNNIITTGTIIMGINSADRLVIDGDVSCKTFSITGSAVGKGIIFPSGTKLNVYGDFDLTGSGNKFAVDGVTKLGYFLGGTINFAGTNNYIKSGGNNLALGSVKIIGQYQLLDNYNQTGIDANSFNEMNLEITNKLTTNGFFIRASNLYCNSAGAILDMSNSIFNLNRFYIQSTILPVTVGTENIYLSDTIAFTNGSTFYSTYLCTGSYTINSLNFYYSKENSKGACVINSPLTCKKIKTNNYFKTSYCCPSALTADTFQITDAGSVILDNGSNIFTFRKIIVPSICDKNVFFSSNGYSSSQAFVNVSMPNTLNYTSWQGINIVGLGSITANNSLNIINNGGNLVINTPTLPRTLAWCGSVDSDWNNSANWRLASTAGCGVCPPTNIDSVIFDPIFLSGASIQTVSITNPAYSRGISFLYPNINPIFIKGDGTLMNGSGLWIGYVSGSANSSLKGTDWSGFTGYLNFISNKKSNLVSTQNVPINNIGVKLQESGVTFLGGGEWTFNDDFTAQKTLLSLLSGTLNFNNKTVTTNALYNVDNYNKPSVMNFANSLINLVGTSSAMNVGNNYGKTFINGGTSKIVYNPTINGYNSGSNFIALALGAGGVDTLGNTSIRFNKFEINSGGNSFDKYINTFTAGTPKYFIRKLTINSTCRVSFFSYTGNLTNLLEIDTLDLTSGNRLILPATNNPLSSAVPNTSVAIIINNAILTNPGCGASFSNIESDSPILSANINIPSDFGANKVIVNNVTINNGTGTLTATNSFFTGSNAGWVSTPVVGNKFYWNGEGSNTHWSNYRNWNYNIPPNPTSTDDSGNNPSQCIPGPADSVFFVNNSFPTSTHTVVMDGNISVKTVKWSLTDQSVNSINWTDTTGSSLTLYESLHLNNRVITSFTNNLTFLGNTQQDTIRTEGRILKPRIIYFKGTGKYTLADDFFGNSTLYFNSGHFDTWSHNLDVYNFYSYNSTSTRTVNISNSIVNLTRNSLGWDYVGGSGLWHYNSNNSTLLANGSTLIVNADNSANSLGITLGHSSFHNSGSTPVQYHNIIFKGVGGGNIYSDVDNTLSIDKLTFNSPSSGIFGSNKIDTLIYSPMSTNFLESGKTQSVDSLLAISNNCQPITIKAYTGGSYAYLCDIGSYKKLKAIFGDIIDVKSDLCSGFTPSYETVNGSITNSPGWSSSSSVANFGFPVHSYSISCKDDGVSLNASGFYPGINSTYLWSSGSINDSLIANQNATYSLTVTYKPGCSITDTVRVYLSNKLNGTFSITPISCNGGNNGAISFSLTADTNASHIYNYTLLSPLSSSVSSLSSTTSIQYSSISTGIYTVTIRDTSANANICVYTQTININEPNILLTNATITSSVACYGQLTASLTSNPTGGNGGYTYIWQQASNTFSTQNINSVSAGLYSLTVVDSKSCIATETLQVTQPIVALTSSLSSVNNVLCYGSGTGAATVTATGGTGLLTYSWMPSGGTSAISNSLTASDYTVNIFDANSCVTTQTFTITQPTQSLSLLSLINNTIACNGGTTNVIANISGGTSPYNYTWTANSSNSNSANYTAGNYSVMISDANNCTLTALPFTVTEPTLISIQITTLTNISCNTPTAMTSYIGNGGTPSYTYGFNSQFGTTPNFTTTNNMVQNLSADNYTLSIVDLNGCSTYTTFSIIDNSNPPIITSSSQSVSCFGGSNGVITASVNATTAFSYLWSNGNTTNSINGLTAGTYSLTVTDLNSCVTIHTVNLSEPIVISISELTNNASCDNNASGLLNIMVTGGIPNYNIKWSNGDSLFNISQLSPGIITATITDGNGCNAFYSTTILEENCLVTFIPEIITPDGDGKNDFFEINTINYFPNNKLFIYNRWGNLIYKKDKYDNSFNGKANVSNSIGNGMLPSSTYFVVFDFGDDKTPVYNGYLELKY